MFFGPIQANAVNAATFNLGDGDELCNECVVLGDFNIQLHYILRDRGSADCKVIPSDVKQFFEASCYGSTCYQQILDETSRDIDHTLTSKGKTLISQKCTKENCQSISDGHTLYPLPLC